jgi:hypothetical protein
MLVREAIAHGSPGRPQPLNPQPCSQNGLPAMNVTSTGLSGLIASFG